MSVTVSGFSMSTLNGKYRLNTSLALNGQPTYWEPSSIYFMYWCTRYNKYMITNSGDLATIRAGGCRGYAKGEGTARASGLWMEWWKKKWSRPVSAVVSCGSAGTNSPLFAL